MSPVTRSPADLGEPRPRGDRIRAVPDRLAHHRVVEPNLAASSTTTTTLRSWQPVTSFSVSTSPLGPPVQGAGADVNAFDNRCANSKAHQRSPQQDIEFYSCQILFSISLHDRYLFKAALTSFPLHHSNRKRLTPWWQSQTALTAVMCEAPAKDRVKPTKSCVAAETGQVKVFGTH